ncbi:adenine nucleotide alpha hydrolases-like protein [Marasmius fiardii PR-910]|nr:adenine nucleotide alpha hydrolases-like protein [Marasmius fiardii PR-910]
MNSLRALSKRVSPITRDEFAKFFQKSRPPVGWPETIAVGNSGGPDSTCLLFLIHRHLKENAGQLDIPQRVVSVHVNHGLQAASDDMARRCADVAKSLGIEHHTHDISWGEQGISPKPVENSPITEYSARIGRYRTLFAAMMHTNANVLALGHHLDDQIETAVMRIYKGSTEEGAAGMKFCRRWGMGFGGQAPNKDFGWNAHEGMKKWIARPLLELTKERLRATCEENKLEYVTDETNSMAHVTFRNTIRMWLKRKGDQTEDSPDGPNLDRLERKISHFKSNIVSVDLSSGIEELYSSVMALNAEAQDVESQVDSILSRCTLRSPPGTWMATCRGISFVRDEKLRRAIILRILRFISFHPWGSLTAQVKRRSTSLTQISDKIWNPDPLPIPDFCAGGGVQWSPVVISGAHFRLVNRHSSPSRPREDQSAGWIAFRQRPPTGGTDKLLVDITPILASHLKLGTGAVLEYLYDCRFLLKFDVTRIPREILRVIHEPESEEGLWLVPWGRWYWPRLVWRRPGLRDVALHSTVTLQTPSTVTNSFDGQLDLSSKPEIVWHNNPQPEAPWVKAEFIRALSGM